MRANYRHGVLTEQQLGDDPLQALERWIDEAGSAGTIEPNSMALATVSGEGEPSVRFVLCKGVDRSGIVFYTNLESRKARDLTARPVAAATFWWDRLERQVRLEGPVRPAPDTDADSYFASRPHGSKVGAWASPQSRELAGRDELERRFAETAERYPVGAEVPRPPFWGGYRLEPLRVEFWQGRENRVHDRILYQRSEVGESAWRPVRLAP